MGIARIKDVESQEWELMINESIKTWLEMGIALSLMWSAGISMFCLPLMVGKLMHHGYSMDPGPSAPKTDSYIPDETLLRTTIALLEKRGYHDVQNEDKGLLSYKCARDGQWYFIRVHTYLPKEVRNGWIQALSKENNNIVKVREYFNLEFTDEILRAHGFTGHSAGKTEYAVVYEYLYPPEFNSQAVVDQADHDLEQLEAYLRSKRVKHTDLCGENFMMRADHTLVLIDWERPETNASDKSLDKQRQFFDRNRRSIREYFEKHKKQQSS